MNVQVAKLAIKAVSSKEGRKIIVGILAGCAAFIFLIITAVGAIIEAPLDVLKALVLSDRDMVYLYQLRPGLISTLELPINKPQYLMYNVGILFKSDGDVITAAGDGKVIECGTDYITIQHTFWNNDIEDYFYTKYERLSEVYVKENNEVTRGMIIGKSQINPEVDENKLFYFSIMDYSGMVVDPTPYLPASQNSNNFSHPIPTNKTISSSFGIRVSPFPPYILEFHQGIDFSAPNGTAILAITDGKVIKASDENNGYGNCVIIQHSDFDSLYGHCSSFNVNVGDDVKKGDVIAYVGSTGRSTGDHLHFEISVNDEPLDPSLFLSKE